MTFMSMVIGGVVFIILGIGFVNMVIGIILDIRWILSAKSKKKTRGVTKVFAVLTSLTGFFAFLLPVGVGIIGYGVKSIKDTMKFNSIENKTYVSEDYEWFDTGFEYKGVKLCPIDFISRDAWDKEQEPDGAVIISEDKYYDIYQLNNEGDFLIYYVDGVNQGMYCAEEEYDEIYDYYYHEASLDATINYYDEDSVNQYYDCEFDSDILFRIRDYYDTRADDMQVNIDEVDVDYYIDLSSEDKCFYESIHLSEIGDCIILEHTCSGGEISGITLTEDEAEYVREAVRKYTDIYE